MNQEIKQKLETLALMRSSPFCYHCYCECPSGRCETCGSDDLMRLLPGVGCEYGTGWVIEQILEAELNPVNLEEAFEESVRECYSETTKIAWAELDTVKLLKEHDPISWRCALADYESQEESAGQIISFDGGTNYYRLNDIEQLAGICRF